MGDAEPFAKAQRRVLGHRVGRGVDLAEQAGGRHGLQQPALAARQHLRQHRVGGMHMGHQVDVPMALPLGGAGIGIDPADDAGIAAEDVDLAELRGGALDQRPHLGFVRHIGAHRQRPGSRAGDDRHGHRGGAVTVQIGHHHAAGTGLGKGLAERLADARGTARDHHHLALDIHHAAVSPGCSTAHSARHRGRRQALGRQPPGAPAAMVIGASRGCLSGSAHALSHPLLHRLPGPPA